MSPRDRRDFRRFESLLRDKIPFQFVRFSDGEMEIIRNERLEISENRVAWSRGIVEHAYPSFDFKTFDPIENQSFREDLLASARHRGDSYFKGIPTRHNKAIADRDLMVSLNGGPTPQLTFADLFLNRNFPRYLNRIVPLFRSFDQVVVLGNFRMDPKLMSPSWQLTPVPDNFFGDYEETLQRTLQSILNAPANCLVLASASSLSNVVGHRVSVERKDLTYVDIGTTLHNEMGMESGIREYHVVAQPWTRDNMRRKIRYRFSRNYSLKW